MDNTGTGVPLIHYSLIQDAPYMELTVIPACAAPQTFSALKMFPVGTPISELKKFVYETVANISGAVCPPMIIGVGIGGLFGTVGELARAASLRQLNLRNPDPEMAKLEEELLSGINTLGIGHMAAGGGATALAVNVEWTHTHITCVPIAVQMQCWCCRRATVRIHDDGRVEKW
jgi:tartrate/fumarate subfamily iron-sulfur-dependent hydro-lyase alpha chain